MVGNGGGSGGGGAGGGGGGMEVGGGSGAHGAAGSSSSSSGGIRGGLLKKGPWTAAEDEVLMQYVRAHGEGNWNAVQKHSGLNRCGKSCRLRWANHLRPNLKKGSFNYDEERLILELHAKYGNKWARMATQLPGRTDNEIKNYWNTRVKRRKRQGLPLYPNDIHHHHHHQQQQQQQQQIQSPTNITTITTTTPTTPPTTPSTTTSFPFQSPQLQYHQQSNTTNNFDPASTTLPFSFQYRPVPLLAAPIPRFKPFPPPSSSASAMPPYIQLSSELPSTQFHQIVDAPMPEIHHRIHNGGLLDDILENLLEENNSNNNNNNNNTNNTNVNHNSIDSSYSELVPKEEPREHINTLPEDLSKFLNFAPTSGTLQAPVGPPPLHWYNHHGGEMSSVQSEDNLAMDMQQLASFFPVVSETATSTTNYAPNPTSWDSLPGICKGWFKHT